MKPLYALIEDTQHEWLKLQGPMARTLRRLIQEAMDSDTDYRQPYAHKFSEPPTDRFVWWLEVGLKADTTGDGKPLTWETKQAAISYDKQLTDEQKKILFAKVREEIT